MKIGLTATAVAACVVGGLLVPAAPALAIGGVGCGDEISQDVRLTRDLTCAGNGLYLAVSTPITIDLNGHTIRGSGTGYGIGEGTPGGGPSATPFHHVDALTVRNGTIRGFDHGIDAQGVADLQVQSDRFLDNGTGVYANTLEASFRPLSVISSSAFRNNTGSGADVLAGTVTDSTFDHNGVGVTQRSLGSLGGYADVTHSTFRSNAKGMACSDGNVNVASSSFRDNTIGLGGIVDRGTWICGVDVTGSTFRGSQVGISMFWVWHGRISDSTFTDSTVGIEMSSGLVTDFAVADNTFADNGASGLYVNNPVPPAGIVPIGITGNTFKDNGFAPGSWVTASGAPLDAGAWANTGVFTGNAAKGNAGYGIEGYGVVDGGGNVAKDNGAPGQCLGVTCASS